VRVVGLVALEGVHHQREPSRIGQQADGDLWLQPALLAEPGLTEPVTLLSFEVQRGHVVQHQRRRAQPGMRGARAGDPVPPRFGGVPGQPAVDRRIRRRRNTDLLQHPDRLQLAGRLDDPGQHQSLEHLIPFASQVEPQHLVGRAERFPQPLGPGRQDRQLGRTWLTVSEIETELASMQPLLGDRLQQLQLNLVMG
jgi:hypothetical protein